MESDALDEYVAELVNCYHNFDTARFTYYDEQAFPDSRRRGKELMEVYHPYIKRMFNGITREELKKGLERDVYEKCRDAVLQEYDMFLKSNGDT